MRVVISWWLDNCIFQKSFKREDLPKAKILFYDKLKRFYDTEYIDTCWKNLENEFDPALNNEPDLTYTERIHSQFIVTYLT